MQNKIFDLIKLLVTFQGVERGVVVPGSTRKENDTEHSYNLAMAAWIIIQKDNLPLDVDKVLRYSLIHDLVEVYAGDSFALDPIQVAGKKDKEDAALAKLAQDPLTADLMPYIQEYEALANEEAKFVYSLDKLMPAFGILYDHGSIWKDHAMSPSDWEEKFRAKAEVSRYMRPYLEFIISEQKKRPEMFV